MGLEAAMALAKRTRTAQFHPWIVPLDSLGLCFAAAGSSCHNRRGSIELRMIDWQTFRPPGQSGGALGLDRGFGGITLSGSVILTDLLWARNHVPLQANGVHPG